MTNIKISAHTSVSIAHHSTENMNIKSTTKCLYENHDCLQKQLVIMIAWFLPECVCVCVHSHWNTCQKRHLIIYEKVLTKLNENENKSSWKMSFNFEIAIYFLNFHLNLRRMHMNWWFSLSRSLCPCVNAYDRQSHTHRDERRKNRCYKTHCLDITAGKKRLHPGSSLIPY